MDNRIGVAVHYIILIINVFLNKQLNHGDDIPCT